jgi:hypothetical protein
MFTELQLWVLGTIVMLGVVIVSVKLLAEFGRSSRPIEPVTDLIVVSEIAGPSKCVAMTFASDAV